MGSQNPLEIEWSNHEIMPKEDEVFSFQHQLPPLDFRYLELGCSNYDLDATYLMDIVSKTPICSSMDILPDPTVLYEDGFLVGRDGELGLPHQEISTMNSLSFPNQEMNSLGFPNQEVYMMNTFGFSYQTQPVIMATKDVKNKEETKMVRNVCEQQQKKLDQQVDNGNIGDRGCDSNYPLRMALSKEMISQYFYMPISDAAKELNVGITLLKKRCRDLGIRRWPHRKLMSLQTLITNVKQELGTSSGNGVDQEKLQEAIMRLENEKKKMEEVPDLQLEDNTKRLRQACFKANYKKRKTIGTRSSKNSSTLTTYPQSSSSCSSTLVDHGGYEAMEDGYYGDYEEHEEMKSLLFTGCFPSSSNTLL
ncbi:hypothetical protein L2E82_46592 [Cichorium intybus]|uniref:Uncharacterized protein n=1 Tax=Cichorium intybus TaxID=13427 RepID=A0ACB8YUH1_CICIN|nr:hypothetical protein L1887_26303 [Cichorium endivia]KAI3688773.1 hypothetical protein L2E82_46592 [Cichorium intybus]